MIGSISWAEDESTALIVWAESEEGETVCAIANRLAGELGCEFRRDGENAS